MRAAMILAALGSLSAAGAVPAQTSAPLARAFSYFTQDDANRPRLGISTRSTGKRDTLGLLVDDVTRDGPADKAGIEEGDRLVSVNGVNLRLSREDAEDEEMSGVATRRLTRELAKHKAGDEVELRVYRDGQTRTVRAKVVAADDLEPVLKSVQSMRTAMADRAVLGVSLGGSGSRRDTLGILVVGVTDSGPAARAGIEEGDRLAAINGVDLRVDRDDAGDWDAANARIRRLNRAMEKVKAGDDVELRVYSQGQTRTVHAKASRSGDLRRQGGGFFMEDGRGAGANVIRIRPSSPAAPSFRVLPRIYLDGAGGARLQSELQARLKAKAQALRGQIDSRLGQRRSRSVLDAEGESTPTPAYAPRIATAQAVRAAPVPSFGVRAGAPAFPRAMAMAATPSPDAYGWRAARAAGNGTITMPGLRLAVVGDDLASYLGDGSERGLLVIESRDQWRPIHAGDVILSVDGRDVRRADGTTSVTFDGRSPPVVELLRGGKRMRVTIER